MILDASHFGNICDIMSTPQIVIKTASREIVRGRASGTFLTFSIPLEHKNGHVFLLADIDSSCKVSPKIIALMRETVERLARSLSGKSHLQHRFEQALQSVNTDLKEIVNVKTCPPESLNMVMGVLQNNTFIISAASVLPALFLRKTAQQRFRVFDLQQNISSATGQLKPEKLFHVVIDGDLQPDDILLLASRDLHKLISVEDIHQLISTLPPSSALETLEQYLPTNAKLAMLLFQVRMEKELITGFGTEVSSAASMDALKKTEKTTEAMLDLEKPHVYQALLKLAKTIRFGSKIERNEAYGRIRKKIIRGIKSSSLFILQVISNTLVSIVSLVKALFTKGGKRTRAIDDAKGAWQRTWKSGQKFQLASLTSKLFLISAVFFIVLFGSSIAYFNLKKVRQETELAFIAQLELVDQKRDEASASIIYNDDTSARIKLNEASSILANMSSDGKEDRQVEINQRIEQIEAQLSKIRKIISPEIVSTPLINQVVSASANQTLFFQNGNVGVFRDNSVESSLPTGNTSTIRVATNYKNDVVGVNSENNFIYFSSQNNSISQIGINSSEGEAQQTRDIVHYGERMYVLSGNQVYRHQRVEGGEYGPGVAWIQDDTDISEAYSIAIDGTIWIAGNKAIRRFDGGREVGAITQSIDPPLGTVKDIWTDTDTSVLLILDTEQRRVVVYNKETGDMIGQIINPAFEFATEIYSDIASKVVTVISPSTIHTFSISEIL